MHKSDFKTTYTRKWNGLDSGYYVLNFSGLCSICIHKQNRPFPVMFIPKIIYFPDKICHKFFQHFETYDRQIQSPDNWVKTRHIVARWDPGPRSASAASERGRAHVSGDGSSGPGRGNIQSRWHTHTLQSGRRPGVVIQNGAPVRPDPSPNQNLILSHFVQILLLPYFRYFGQKAQTIYHTIGCHQVELWLNQTIKTT